MQWILNLHVLPTNHTGIVTFTHFLFVTVLVSVGSFHSSGCVRASLGCVYKTSQAPELEHSWCWQSSGLLAGLDLLLTAISSTVDSYALSLRQHLSWQLGAGPILTTLTPVLEPWLCFVFWWEEVNIVTGTVGVKIKLCKDAEREYFQSRVR